eukprot:14640496-Alexandrium_andersonii.AAC.1
MVKRVASGERSLRSVRARRALDAHGPSPDLQADGRTMAQLKLLQLAKAPKVLLRLVWLLMSVPGLLGDVEIDALELFAGRHEVTKSARRSGR